MDAVLDVDAASIVGRHMPAGGLGEKDRSLGGLSLTEEHRVIALGGSGSPVIEELSRDRRDSGIPSGAPKVDFVTNVIDQGVSLAPLAGRVKVQAQLGFALLSGRDRDEGLARSPALEDRSSRPV